jgi:hypothetical protein
MNEKLKGFRGLLVILVSYVGMYVDAVVTNLTGITEDQVKIAALLAVPQAVKLIYTDAWPRISNWIADKLA